MEKGLKGLCWLGRSREIVQRFVKSVRSNLGYQLYRLQSGLLPTDYKPMKNIGAGVWEIRLHQPHEHRVIYVAKFENNIHVLHAFEKKTQKTSKSDIDIAKKNYQTLVQRMKNIKAKE